MGKTTRRRNNHHLVWPRASQTGIRKAVRQLPCLQVLLDVEVHRILHQMYGVPRQMSSDDCNLLLSRHQDRLCACYSPDQRDNINILAINEQEDAPEEASCESEQP
jgi:hypothetical protein